MAYIPNPHQLAAATAALCEALNGLDIFPGPIDPDHVVAAVEALRQMVDTAIDNNIANPSDYWVAETRAAQHRLNTIDRKWFNFLHVRDGNVLLSLFPNEGIEVDDNEVNNNEVNDEAGEVNDEAGEVSDNDSEVSDDSDNEVIDDSDDEVIDDNYGVHECAQG